jgi:uncharacterized metal-binding protein
MKDKQRASYYNRIGNPFRLYDDDPETTKKIKAIVDVTVNQIKKALQSAGEKIERLDKKTELGITDTDTSDAIAEYFEEQLEEKEIQDKLQSKKDTIVNAFWQEIHR